MGLAGRVALGKHTCLAGEPGAGKSHGRSILRPGLAWALRSHAARASPQGSVIILSAEDSVGDTIVPRLHAAGADLGRISIVKAVEIDESGRRGFNLQADLDPSTTIEDWAMFAGHH